MKFANDENRQTFYKGYFDEIQKYQKKNGVLLDIVKMVERYYKRGYSLNVIDLDGESNPNVFGVNALNEFEIAIQSIVQKRAVKIQKTKNPFIRVKINYTPTVNVLNKTITIDLRDVNTDIKDPKNTDVMDMSNS